MLKKRDYYVVLGVDRKADLTMIKKAYHERAMDLHPDRNPGDKFAGIRFRELSEAYAVLKHPQKRAAYDLENSAEEKSAYKNQPTYGYQQNTTENSKPDIKKYTPKKDWGLTFDLSHVLPYSYDDVMEFIKIFALIGIPFIALIIAVHSLFDTGSHSKNTNQVTTSSEVQKK